MQQELQDLKEFIRLSRKYGKIINITELSKEMMETKVEVENPRGVIKVFSIRHLGLTEEELTKKFSSKELLDKLEILSVGQGLEQEYSVVYLDSIVEDEEKMDTQPVSVKIN